jgi:NAD(P)-dependent dehydrogenase (short-subunit alcohol dehydrogenase family)
MLIRREVDSDMDAKDYNIIGIGCDVSSEFSVQQAFRRTMDTYGRVDSVVASAGTFSRCSVQHAPSHTPGTCQASSKTTPRSTTRSTG